MSHELLQLFDPENAKAVQEVAKATAGAIEAAKALGQYTADVLGPLPRDTVGMLGDYVAELRVRNLDRLQRKTAEILRRRKAKLPLPDPDPSVVAPIFMAAASASSDELRDLWARLLAAAVDPSRSKGVRKRFGEALQQMDPVDARVFETFGKGCL